MYSIFLQQHELILISSDVTAHTRAFCGTRAHILPSFFGKVVRAAHFRTLTAYNKKTKTNFQKLISKPFSTYLNLSNKLNLWKRCSWPLIIKFDSYIDLLLCQCWTCMIFLWFGTLCLRLRLTLWKRWQGVICSYLPHGYVLHHFNFHTVCFLPLHSLRKWCHICHIREMNI